MRTPVESPAVFSPIALTFIFCTLLCNMPEVGGFGAAGKSVTGCAGRKGFFVKRGVCVKAEAGVAGGGWGGGAASGGSVSICGGRKGFFRSSGKCVKVSGGRVNSGFGSALGGARFGGGIGRHLLEANADSPIDGTTTVSVDTEIPENEVGIETSDAEAILADSADFAIDENAEFIDIYPYVDTPEFQSNLGSAVCPEEFLAQLRPELEPFISGCASDEPYPDFCLDCVVPIMDKLTSVSHTHLKISFDDDIEAEAAMRAKCGEGVVDHLVSKGVVADDDFNDRVMGCMIYTGNPECPAAAQLEPMLESPSADIGTKSEGDETGGQTILELFGECKAKAVILAEELANGTIVDELSATSDGESSAVIKNEEEADYCMNCYWPYVKLIVNQGVSDEYWCKFKQSDLYNNETGIPQNLPVGSFETLRDVQEGLYADTGFVACMGSARAFFRREGPDADPFSFELNHLIYSDCWQPGVIPDIDDVIMPATVDMINALPCGV